MRKIIFLDVDGTLVDYHNRIPDRRFGLFDKLVKMGTWSMSVLVAVEQKCSQNCGKLGLME